MSRALPWIGAVLPLAISLQLGCGTSVKQVARMEAEGDLPGLKAALSHRDPAIRRAAAASLVRYAAYTTTRPAMLATLSVSRSPEAQEAARGLIGQPPAPTPDPEGAAGNTPPRGAAIYLYRPAADGRGPAPWLVIDGRVVARLHPGRHYRYETDPGSHRITLQLAGADDEEGARLVCVVSAPTPGAYFVRHTLSRGKPTLDMMPVPPALTALQAGRPAEAQDVDPAEARRTRRRAQAVAEEQEP
jgi:hypothetical protein